MSSFTNAIEAGSAFLKVVVDDKEVAKGFERVQAKMDSVGKSMKKVGAVAAGVGAAITGPMLASIKVASDAQETMSKFNVVFGQQAAAMKKWGDDVAASVGRSKYEIAAFAAGFQDLLVPMGMAPDAAAAMSKQLTTLAIDLASFNNMSDADTIRDLTAALTGSGEVMKKYGVIVSEAAVKQELLNMNLDPKTVTEAEKAQARLNIIMRGTTAAQGDALRTADGFANSMKALQAQLHDTAVEIGNAILPAVTKFVHKAIEMTKWASAFVAANPDLTAAIAAIRATASVAGGAIYLVGGALTAVSAHPIIAALAGVAGAAYAIKKAFDAVHKSVEETGESIRRLRAQNADRRSPMERSFPVGSLAAADREVTLTADWQEAERQRAEARRAAADAANRTVPFANMPSIDPMQQQLADLGLNRIDQRDGAPDVSWIGGALSDAWDDLVQKAENTKLSLQLKWEGSEFQDQVQKLWEGMKEFLAGGLASSTYSSMGTFSAGAVGALDGVDNQILQVNREQLAALNRIERKDDPWKVGGA